MNQQPGEAPLTQSGPNAIATGTAPVSALPKERFAGFDAFRVPAYRWYILCAVLQQTAESMKQLANGWFAYELTGSTAILGLTILAQAVPQTFMSLFGGVIADRYPRHRVWQICNVAALLLPVWMATLVFTHTITWHALVIQSFLFGFVLAVRAPARQGIMTELVGRDRIMSAVSLNQTANNILQFAGPAIAGFAIAWLGIQWVYVGMAVFYVFAILSLIPMKYQRRNVSLQSKGRGSVVANLKDGLKYVGRNPDVKAVLGLTLLAGAFAMPYNQLLPAFGKSVLGIGPAKLGILASLTGIGALSGSLGITLIRPKVRGVWLIRIVVITGVALIAFSLSRSFAFAGAIIIIIGVTQAVRQTLQSTLVQTYTEDAFLGRVISINMAQMGLSSLTSFGVAIVAEAIGVRYAILGTAFLLLGVGLSYFFLSRRLRDLV